MIIPRWRCYDEVRFYPRMLSRTKPRRTIAHQPVNEHSEIRAPDYLWLKRAGCIRAIMHENLKRKTHGIILEVPYTRRRLWSR